MLLSPFRGAATPLIWRRSRRHVVLASQTERLPPRWQRFYDDAKKKGML